MSDKIYLAKNEDLNAVSSRLTSIESCFVTAVLKEKDDTSDYGDYNKTELQTAINNAITKNAYVRIPNGTFYINGQVTITSGKTVSIIGAEDVFANGLNRDSEMHPYHYGSCICYTGSANLFVNGGESYLFLKNLMLTNEKTDGTYINAARIWCQSKYTYTIETEDDEETKTVTQGGYDTKGKLYIDGCVIAGWKCVAGNNDNSWDDPRCCVLASRTRFCKCTAVTYNNVDGRIVDCSVNTCTDGFVFNCESSYTTIANTRIEWCSNTGISISESSFTYPAIDEASGHGHDITIIGCELDCMGGAGIYATKGRKLLVNGCMLRRCGKTSGKDGAEYDISISNINGLTLVGNQTVYKDTDSGVKKPEHCYSITNCENVVNIGNDWSGCETAQENDCGSLPLATGKKRGVVNPISKTDTMTLSVGIDANGNLWADSYTENGPIEARLAALEEAMASIKSDFVNGRTEK